MQANILDEQQCKISHQNISKLNSRIHKKITHHGKVIFIPGSQEQFNKHKPINMIHHINKQKQKNHISISIDTKKANFYQSEKQTQLNFKAFPFTVLPCITEYMPQIIISFWKNLEDSTHSGGRNSFSHRKGNCLTL